MSKQSTNTNMDTALANLVHSWRDAEKHWRKQASAVDRDYAGQPVYYDGLAEAFGRCADILANTMAGAPTP